MNKLGLDYLNNPPSIPELNGVANAIAILENAKDSVLIWDKTLQSLNEAIEQLKKYCEFVHQYEDNPQFWHEFKERNK